MQSETEMPVAGGKPGRLARLAVPFRWTGRFISRWLDVIEVLAWVAFFVCALGFLALRYWLLPSVEKYREDIVAAVSKGTGLNVTVGAIEPDWRGFLPRLVVADVRVYDPAGNEAIVLPVVDAVVSWRSLLHAELRLHSLAIDGPRLPAPRSTARSRSPASGSTSGRATASSQTGSSSNARSRCATPRSAGSTKARRAAARADAAQLSPAQRDYEHSSASRGAASLGSALGARRARRPGPPDQSWSGACSPSSARPTSRVARVVRLPDRRAQGKRRGADVDDADRRRSAACDRDLALTGVVGQLAKDLPCSKSRRSRAPARPPSSAATSSTRELALVSGRGSDMR
jgi:hypothetical protein